MLDKYNRLVYYCCMLKHIESGIGGRMLNTNSLFWLQKVATQLGIKGVVFTKRDGSIKLMADGEEKNLIEFAKKIETGGIFYETENFYVKWSEPRENSGDFYILNN